MRRLAAVLALSLGSPPAVVLAQPGVSEASGREGFASSGVPEAVGARRQETLIEMWKRRILDTGTERWGAEDADWLDRIRAAERAGALELLRREMGSLRGYAVAHDVPTPGRPFPKERKLWLTKAGFQQYAFLRSQMARKYFEARGSDAKHVFRLKDVEGRPLFDARGELAPVGEALYGRILRGERVQWRNSAGEIETNRPERPVSKAPHPTGAPDKKQPTPVGR